MAGDAYLIHLSCSIQRVWTSATNPINSQELWHRRYLKTRARRPSPPLTWRKSRRWGSKTHVTRGRTRAVHLKKGQRQNRQGELSRELPQRCTRAYWRSGLFRSNNDAQVAPHNIERAGALPRIGDRQRTVQPSVTRPTSASGVERQGTPPARLPHGSTSRTSSDRRESGTTVRTSNCHPSAAPVTKRRS